MENPKVYVILKGYVHEGYDEPTRYFTSREKAEIAANERMKGYNPRNVWMDVFELELDETEQREGQGAEATAVGEGPDPKPIPEAGA